MTLKPSSISTPFALAAAAAALAGCWSNSKPGTTPQRGDVTVNLAAVTLADDCGEDFAAPPPVAAGESVSQSRAPITAADIPPGVAQGSCASEGDCAHIGRRACEQTTMQLSVRSTAGAPTSIRIKRVELVDEHGTLIGQLDARAPVVWVSDAYKPWDQTVAPGATLAASYALSAPPWEQLEGGRWGAASKSFQLRVTLAVGEADRTIDKVAIVSTVAPAMIEPPVVT